MLLVNRSLEEIDSLLPTLAQFPCLEALNLADNSLKSLPSDLSSLKNLRSLNINNNLLDDFEEVVRALQTLPALKAVSLNLQRNEEVELVLGSLPGLEILNEQRTFPLPPLVIEQDETNQKENEEKSNLEAAQSLEPTQLHDPFNSESSKQCSQESPNLSKQNNSSPNTEKLSHSKEEVKFKALEQAVAIHDNFRAYSKKRDPNKDKELEMEFREQMASIAGRLGEGGEREVSLFGARNEILGITFGKMIELADEDVYKIWSSIKEEHDEIVQGLLEIAARNVIKDASNWDNTQALREQFEAEKKELMDQIASLESENKKYLDTLIKRSKATGAPKAAAPKTVKAKPKEAKRVVTFLNRL